MMNERKRLIKIVSKWADKSVFTVSSPISELQILAPPRPIKKKICRNHLSLICMTSRARFERSVHLFIHRISHKCASGRHCWIHGIMWIYTKETERAKKRMKFFNRTAPPPPSYRRKFVGRFWVWLAWPRDKDSTDQYKMNSHHISHEWPERPT